MKENQKSSLKKNIVREIARTKSRFISIFAIIGISVGFFTGVKSACPSMVETAERYFEENALMDINLVSTVGFDDDDIADIKNMDFVRDVMPSYSMDLIASNDNIDSVVRVMALPDEKTPMNVPLLREGRLPETDTECLMDRYYASLTGKHIGDTVNLNPQFNDNDTSDYIKHLSYKIVGLADVPLYLSLNRGHTTIGNGSIAFFILVKPEELISERYTKVFITTKASDSGLAAFSDEYKNMIEDEKKALDKISETCISRFNENTVETAKQKLADAQKEYADKKQEAQQKIADGEKQLADGEKEYQEKIVEGEQKLADGEKELEEGRKNLADGQEEYTAKIEKAKQELADARQQYEAGKAEYEKGLLEYNTKIRQGEEQLNSAQKEFDKQYQLFYQTTKPQAEQQLQTLETALEAAEIGMRGVQSALRQIKNVGVSGDEEALRERLAEYQEQITDYQRQYNEGMIQLDNGEKQLLAAQQELEAAQQEFETQKTAGAIQLSKAESELNAAQNQISAGERELQTGIETGLLELQEAQRKLDKGEKELEKGKAELETQKQAALEKLEKARQELEEGKKEADMQLADAEKQLADAQKKIDALDNAKWYIYDRYDDNGYSTLTDDAQRVDNIAKVFPLFFLIVAALVCLTTMSRMVEERRTEIGTLKALGYSNADISSKYLIYAGTAGLGGCLVGGFLGVLTLPKVIVGAYDGIMYLLPSTKLVISWDSYLISSVIAVVCICMVAIVSCRNDLKIQPATLMRPKAPKPGKRILLEYITPVWKRLNFTSKVTARNLFRYKVRFLMTVIGVAGCTALIVAGFGMLDSITSIADRQYVDLTKYEQIYSLAQKGTVEEKAELMKLFEKDDRFQDTMLAYMVSAKTSARKSNTVLDSRVIIGENNEDFQKMFVLRDRKTHDGVSLSDTGIVIDERASDILKIKKGDTMDVTIDEAVYHCTVSGITENYAGNFIYMTPTYYESITGQTTEYNAVLALVSDSAKNSQHEMANDYMKNDEIITVSLITEQVDAILDTLNSLNIVVFVMILCAGLLAVVVLYNLTNINIAERVREIATIKVLGFYSLETANYIYRENIILTIVGAVGGLLMGSMLTGFIVESIQMNNVMFPKIVTPMSYVWGFVLTMVFSLLVNFIMYFKMNKISMVESLKSIE